MPHSGITAQIVDSDTKVLHSENEELDSLHRCDLLPIRFEQGQRELEHLLLRDGEKLLSQKLTLSQHDKVPLRLRSGKSRVMSPKVE